jgi:hypothetical protein
VQPFGDCRPAESLAQEKLDRCNPRPHMALEMMRPDGPARTGTAGTRPTPLMEASIVNKSLANQREATRG